MDTKTIFLASSAELKGDREQFEIFVNRKNNDWVTRGVHLRLIIWEDFLDALAKTRLQDEYNDKIRSCDLFVMLFCTKVGCYTEEEFDVAVGQFHGTSKPFIFTYFKDDPAARGQASREDLQSLWAFQDKLKALGHFQAVYQNIDGLLRDFGDQLDKLVAERFIEFRPDGRGGSAATTYQANQVGSGAIAQGPQAQAVGAGGVVVGGNNTGTIVTGTRIRTTGSPGKR